MSHPLTPSQASAVDHAAGDALVLAGAGSGKTTVLTERYLTLARREGALVRRIAALTFTEKAASEMRERIAAAFAAAPDLASRARDVEFAPISTIHAYGARLLREHAVEAGIDPTFDLLDETGATMLREDVWSKLDRRLRRRGDERRKVLRRLGSETAWRDVLDLHVRLRGAALTIERVHIVSSGPSLADALVELRRALDDVDVQVAQAGFAPDDIKAYLASRVKLPVEASLAVATDDAVRRASRVAGAKLVGDVLVLPKKRPKTVTAARNAVQAAYEVVVASLLDEIAKREIDEPLRSLLVEYDAALEREKGERGVLDFSDLEVRVLALLDRFAARRRVLPGRPLELLVDEFQDVNPVQAAILERLCGAGLGRRVDLFAVGDPKQSIYRFRGADVGVIERQFAQTGVDGRHQLADSFRSRPELVAFHNALFPRLFAATADPGAPAVPYEPLVSRAEFVDRDTPIPVEFALVVCPSASGRTRSEAEADVVADRIVAWTREGTLRTKRERGRSPSAPRPLGYGDIAILVRARGNLPAFERALAARGIPFHTGKGRGYYDTEEMRDLVHLLRVVHDPLDGFAVAAWLASPAVGATDEDLLAVFGGKGAGGRRESPLVAATRRPALKAAVDALHRLRTFAAGSRLEDLIQRAMSTFDSIPTALLQEGGARRAKNLEKALSIARRLDEEGGHGLLDFLRYLSDLKDHDINEAEAAAGAPGDVVSLLTIHAAKGLEWPCVIVADTNRRDRHGTPAFHVARDGGVGWRVRDPLDGVTRAPGGYAALAETDAAADARESTRLLYVALTRAEERLVVTTSCIGRNKDGGPSRLSGWGKTLWETLDAPSSAGTHVVPGFGAPIDVRVLDFTPGEGEVRAVLAAAPPATRLPVAAAVDLAGFAAARARIAAPVSHLHRTPFVVPISDLLLFAQSPARYYDERVLGADPVVRTRIPRRERDDPAARQRHDDGGSAGEDSPDMARASRDDDEREPLDGVDRAALGRAVHRALERYRPGVVVRALVEASIIEEFPVGSAAAAPLALAMVERFLDSATGQALDHALRAGHAVRREAAFHARIRFPDEAQVGPYRSLLVKGAIDLWMGAADGKILVLDHKTNSPRGRLKSPAALVEHYATQLRLYALAAERVTGKDVAGAKLLLLDPDWGRRVPVEATVDVSGDALRETRDLCRAFAVSMLEDRYPPRWTDLLA